MKIINLKPFTFSQEEINLLKLKLGLNFCLKTNLDRFDLIKDLNLFTRELNFKYLCEGLKHKKREVSLQGALSQCREYSGSDYKALKVLTELEREGIDVNFEALISDSDPEQKDGVWLEQSDQLRGYKKKCTKFPIQGNARIDLFFRIGNQGY